MLVIVPWSSHLRTSDHDLLAIARHGVQDASVTLL